MNYFERCKKRIEEGKENISMTGDTISVNGLYISKLWGSRSTGYYIEFLNTEVPLDKTESEHLYYLAYRYLKNESKLKDTKTLEDL